MVLTSSAFLQNIEAEEALLSGILNYPGGTIDELIGEPNALDRLKPLPPEAFSTRQHRLIYRAMLALHQRGKSPDFLAVTSELLRCQWLDDAGGRSKIASLMYSRLPVNLHQATDSILECYQRRRMIEVATNALTEITNGTTSLEEILQTLNSQLQEVTTAANAPPIDKDERLRLELGALLSENDPIKKLRRRAEIASHYRIRNSDIEMALSAMRQKSTAVETKSQSFENLLSMETTAIPWLIPGYLPRGESVILAGPPKSGKTLLAYDVAFALATGESAFLGESVEKKGRVLLIQSDESLQSTKSKLLKRGFRRQDSPNLKIMRAWTLNQLHLLEEELEDFRPDLVIVDSLRRINHGSQISENSAEFADGIYTLKELLQKYGASGILIHHTSKDKEAQGVYQVRGSSAIAGAVWGTWQLDHIPKPDPNNKKRLIVDPSDPRRIFSLHPRDVEGQKLNISFNPEDNSWLLESNENQVAEQDTLKNRILSILRANQHRQLSGRDIIELLGMSPEEGRGVYTTLTRMESKRLINSAPAPGDKRFNVYSVLSDRTAEPDDQSPHSPSPPPSEENVDYSSESFIQQDFQDTQQITQQLVNNYSTPKTENEAVDYSNLGTVGSSEIFNNFSSLGGERVSDELVADQGNRGAIAPASEVSQIDPWLTEESLRDLADPLNACESFEDFAALRLIWPVHALVAAADRVGLQLVIPRWEKALAKRLNPQARVSLLFNGILFNGTVLSIRADGFVQTAWDALSQKQKKNGVKLPPILVEASDLSLIQS